MNDAKTPLDDLERTALSAAFIAAAVVAGVSLSLVPNVELVTLTLFAGGVVLGSTRGAIVGALGMSLYHLANCALRGFPPSLPFLAAQAVAMAAAGWAGGAWRNWWLAAGRPRTGASWSLPVLGALLAAFGQVLLNLVGAALAAPGGGFRGAFVSGMAFGAVQIAVNALVFAVAGPPVVHALRRVARRRGWWGAPLVAAVLALVVGAGDATAAEPAAADSLVAPAAEVSAEPDTVAGVPDSTMAPATAAADSLANSPAAAVLPPLRPIRAFPSALWTPVDAARAMRLGTPTVVEGMALDGIVVAKSPAPAVAVPWERWGLGWGRTRLSLDGVPLGGPIHAVNEPADVPAAWASGWREAWTAAGTRLDLAPLARRWETPKSTIALTTGSYGRRTTEFGLYRNLRSVNLGVDFADREETDLLLAAKSDITRLWFHLDSTPGRRPDWSLDVANGSRTHALWRGGSYAEASRRLQVALRGPFAGGETRVTAQLRRQAIQTRPSGTALDELLFDGYTVQADWAPPAAGAALRLRWDRDRRRGVLESDATFDGVRAIGTWGRTLGGFDIAAEGALGRQEPWGGTWAASAAVARDAGRFAARLSAAHDESSPAMVPVLDDILPEYGLAGYLVRAESKDPETVDALRVEGLARFAAAGWLRLGGWTARQRYYRIEAVPSWTTVESPFAPIDAVPRSADVVGGYGSLRLPLVAGWFGEGNGRVADRALSEVPYLPRWRVDGALHWRRSWFKDSLDLDAAVGGEILGPREDPAGETLDAVTLGFVRLSGRIDNGILTFAIENLADNFVESSFRDVDATTPVLTAGRHYVLGLTMALED